MPGGNGMGPMGMGPMTGRAMGYCTGYEAPGFANAIPGRGFGFGRGRGRGLGMGLGFRGGRGGATPYYGVAYAYGAPYAAPTRRQQADALQGQAEYLEEALGEIRKRIADLESEKTDS